jgi:putative ABC transport system permease protein
MGGRACFSWPGQALTAVHLRAALAGVDGSQPVADVAAMPARVRQSLARLRLGVTLAGVLGGIAVALGAIGVYGVVSVGVARRGREFGVRLALSATPAGVRALVLREGLSLTLVGVGVGLGGAAATLQVIRGTLGGAATSGLEAAAIAAGVVIACTLAALALPARRAAAVAPVISLRAE